MQRWHDMAHVGTRSWRLAARVSILLCCSLWLSGKPGEGTWRPSWYWYTCMFNSILYTFVFPCVWCSIVYLHICRFRIFRSWQQTTHWVGLDVYHAYWPTSVKRLLYCLSKAAGRHVCIGLVYMYVSTTTMIHVYVGVDLIKYIAKEVLNGPFASMHVWDLHACGKRTLPPSAAYRILGQLTLPTILGDTW